jgi:hypothetical protein
MTTAPPKAPLGFPLTDRQAIALDAILKALPKDDAFRYRKAEFVLARGMNDSQFKQNPIVTMQHCYHLPPVGKSLWRKVVRDGPMIGVKAKTQYPARPKDWPAEQPWPADVALSLVQADLLRPATRLTVLLLWRTLPRGPAGELIVRRPPE